MTGLNAGDLDWEIVMERATTVTDAMNEDVPVWSTWAERWASATPVKDGERLQDGEVRSQIEMRFQIHWTPETAYLDERDRVLYDGRVFDIFGVKEIGQRVGQEISEAARSERT